MSQSKGSKLVLIFTVIMLQALSMKISAEPILSTTLTNGDAGCVTSAFPPSSPISAACTVFGLGTSLVELQVIGVVSSQTGPTNLFVTQDFPLYTLGPIVPGTLTLTWAGYSNPPIFSTAVGVIFDLESGSPVQVFNWGCGTGATSCDGTPTTVSLPFNLGVPFSISLYSVGRAPQPAPGFVNSGAASSVVTVSLASIPEPANFLLVLSGLTALLGGRMGSSEIRSMTRGGESLGSEVRGVPVERTGTA